MYDNHNNNQENTSVYTSALEFLAMIIALSVSALFGTYIANFTMPIILSIALPVFGEMEEGFIKFSWLIVVHLLFFFGATFFLHLKLTSFGAKVVMKPFKEQEEKKGGGFVKAVGWLAILFALFSLTGCNEEQTRKELAKQENDHAHKERMKDKEMNRAITIAREHGNFKLAEQEENHAHYERSQVSRQKHAFDLQEALYTAEQVARETWQKVIDGTLAPLLKFIALVSALLVGFVFIVKRLCAMCEKLAEERTRQEAVKAFAQVMSVEETRKAFKNMGFLSDPSVIDIPSLGGKSS